MIKKIFGLILVLILIAGGFAAWKIFGSSVSTASGEFFYIKTGASYDEVKNDLVSKKYITSAQWFDLSSRILRYKKVKPGRYKIIKGMSVYKLVKMLRAGDQVKVNFVITKLRTRQNLASKIGNAFETDSSRMIQFLSSNDSLRKYGLDTNTVMAAAMPFTYTINWNSTAPRIFEQLYTAYDVYWTNERKAKADSLHLTPIQVSTLASIVEEETRKLEDKFNIASVYINRMRIGMPLQADPTIKFAMKDFGLKRILNAHLETVSPYNTYLNAGLPPGPICTPSVETLEAVLNAPKTDYIYFVASSNFDGSSVFTTNYNDHLKYARLYQQALTKRLDSLNKAVPRNVSH